MKQIVANIAPGAAMDALMKALPPAIAEFGRRMRGWREGSIAEGCTVKAVDLDMVRCSFFLALSSDDDPARWSRVRQAFYRALADAEELGWIGITDRGFESYVWIAREEEYEDVKQSANVTPMRGATR